MLKPLIDRQDHQLARAAKLSLHQDARQIALHAGIVGLIIVQDRANGRCHVVSPMHTNVLPGPIAKPMLRRNADRRLSAERRNPRQCAPFHPFEERAARGRDEREIIGTASLIERRDCIAAAGDRDERTVAR
jgi:hypothetical protein